MKIESFDDGTRLMAKGVSKVGPLTVAQQIRKLSNPYLAAVARCAYRRICDSEDHLADKKIFHFADGSFLTFEVSYTAVEDGGRP
jgi:hypothetical protein